MIDLLGSNYVTVWEIATLRGGLSVMKNGGWVTDLDGVDFRIEFVGEEENGLVMVSRWSPEVEDYTASQICPLSDVGKAMARMSKRPASAENVPLLTPDKSA